MSHDINFKAFTAILNGLKLISIDTNDLLHIISIVYLLPCVFIVSSKNNKKKFSNALWGTKSYSNISALEKKVFLQMIESCRTLTVLKISFLLFDCLNSFFFFLGVCCHNNHSSARFFFFAFVICPVLIQHKWQWASHVHKRKGLLEI